MGAEWLSDCVANIFLQLIQASSCFLSRVSYWDVRLLLVYFQCLKMLGAYLPHVQLSLKTSAPFLLFSDPVFPPVSIRSVSQLQTRRRGAPPLPRNFFFFSLSWCKQYHLKLIPLLFPLSLIFNKRKIYFPQSKTWCLEPLTCGHSLLSVLVALRVGLQQVFNAVLHKILGFKWETNFWRQWSWLASSSSKRGKLRKQRLDFTEKLKLCPFWVYISILRTAAQVIDCMYGCMNWCVDRFMDDCVDYFMDSCSNGCMDDCLNGCMNDCKSDFMNKCKDSCMDDGMNVCMDIYNSCKKYKWNTQRL